MKKNNKRTKVIAMYLPQYHQTKENDLFWGEGFTDWVTVKQAVPLFQGHEQPKCPLNDNYYDLSKIDTLIWQADLAKKYKLDGFCFYHYWFENNKIVLDRPVNNLLQHKEIDLPFMFAWDNTSWVRSWSQLMGNAWAPKYDKQEMDGLGRTILLKVDYGREEDWKKHFEYLLPFFRDDRYIKVNKKPVFIFFSTSNYRELKEMGNYWQILAQKNGLPGLYFITTSNPILRKRVFEREFTYEPMASAWQKQRVIKRYIAKYLGISIKGKEPAVYNYDVIWKKIIKKAQWNIKRNMLYGAFVNYDDTPRRGKKGQLIIGGSPEKFYIYFKKLFEICNKKRKQFVFITAWNEWGEGAYLEPDSHEGYRYLQALCKAIESEA